MDPMPRNSQRRSKEHVLSLEASVRGHDSLISMTTNLLFDFSFPVIFSIFSVEQPFPWGVPPGYICSFASDWRLLLLRRSSIPVSAGISHSFVARYATTKEEDGILVTSVPTAGRELYGDYHGLQRRATFSLMPYWVEVNRYIMYVYRSV